MGLPPRVPQLTFSSMPPEFSFIFVVIISYCVPNKNLSILTKPSSSSLSRSVCAELFFCIMPKRSSSISSKSSLSLLSREFCVPIKSAQ